MLSRRISQTGCRRILSSFGSGGDGVLHSSVRYMSRKPYPEMHFSPAPGDDSAEVIFTEHSFHPLITLNRPKALNSLNMDMVREIYPKIQAYEKNSGIYSIIMQGVGSKAFCAGGDVKALYLEKVNQTGGTLRRDFFKEEYRLNHRIATLKTNYIALLDGITMGGGVGLSVHGHFRVATENTIFAMPETAIGFFPDVGGSYFLPRLKGELGMYLALTGASLKGQDNVHAGIATHFVESAHIPALRERLLELQFEPEAVDSAIRERSAFQRDQPSSFEKFVPLIDECFGKSSVEEVLDALKASKTEFGDSTLKKLQRMSPLSLKVTFKEIREGKSMSIEKCFQMENRISRHMMDGHDFFEGVRAVLVDKDNAPVWKHSSVAAVSDDEVDEYFAPVEDELLLEA